MENNGMTSKALDSRNVQYKNASIKDIYIGTVGIPGGTINEGLIYDWSVIITLKTEKEVYKVALELLKTYGASKVRHEMTTVSEVINLIECCGVTNFDDIVGSFVRLEMCPNDHLRILPLVNSDKSCLVKDITSNWEND